MSQNKVGILVPYRDRPQHLDLFIPKMRFFLQQKNYSFHIFILQQAEGKPFNRGKLINVGILEAEKAKCNYIVTHDVDAIPLDLTLNYGYTDTVRLVYSPHHNSVGGLVTVFNIDVLKKVNGFSNNYWGWGFEDTDMQLRFKNCQIEVDVSEVRIRTAESLEDRERTKEVDGYLQLGHVHSFLKEHNYASASQLVMDYDALLAQFNKLSTTKKVFEQFVAEPQIQWESGLSNLTFTEVERHSLAEDVLIITLEI